MFDFPSQFLQDFLTVFDFQSQFLQGFLTVFDFPLHFLQDFRKFVPYRQMSLHNYKNIEKILNLNIENGPTLLYIKRTLFELSLKIFVTSHVSKI